MSQSLMDISLDRAETRYNMSKSVHDELEKVLNEKVSGREKRTFFDSGIVSK